MEIALNRCTKSWEERKNERKKERQAGWIGRFILFMLGFPKFRRRRAVKLGLSGVALHPRVGLGHDCPQGKIGSFVVN